VGGPAGDAFVAEFELRAALRRGPEPSDYQLAPEPGRYELRMENYVGLHADLNADILVVP
jgi:hypothetical protein